MQKFIPSEDLIWKLKTELGYVPTKERIWSEVSRLRIDLNVEDTFTYHEYKEEQARKAVYSPTLEEAFDLDNPKTIVDVKAINKEAEELSAGWAEMESDLSHHHVEAEVKPYWSTCVDQIDTALKEAKK